MFASSTDRPAMLVLTHLDVWELTAQRGVTGAGNQDMYNTLLGYADAGYDVHVLTTSRNLPHLAQVGEHITVHRVNLPFRGIGRQIKPRLRRATRSTGNPALSGVKAVVRRQSVWFWFMFQFVMLLAGLRFARRCRVHLVYGYEVKGAPVAWLLAKWWRVPCVTRFQGTELAPLISDPRDLRRRYWTWLLSYRVPADLVVMANDGTEGDRILDHVGQNRDRCAFWMNGIDKDRVARPQRDLAAVRREAGVADGEVMVLTSVRLVDWKRHDRALAALAVAQQHIRRFRYVIIGDGPLRELRELQAREFGVAERTNFMGAMPHDRVMDFMAACNIYLSVNDLSNLGNPLIEATLLGRCIVTLDNGATRDLITHGVNGLMYTPDDHEALGDALARLIESPSERARFEAGARDRAETLLTWSQRMDQELETLHRRTRGKTLPPTSKQSQRLIFSSGDASSDRGAA